MRQAASDDSANGYGPDIDQALSRMNADDVAELTTSKQIAAFLIISRFYALSRYAELLGYRVDTEALVVEGDREALFDNIIELRKAAAAEAAVYGFIMEVTDLSQVGSGNQDADQTVGSAWARGILTTGHLLIIEEGEEFF